jgi:hypothetical protein
MNLCNRVTELIGPYLYGGVTPEEAALLENHCGVCGPCREGLALGRQSIALLTPDSPTGEERERILRGVGKQRAVEAAFPPGFRISPRLRIACGFALAVMIFIAGLGVGAVLRPTASVSREGAAPPRPAPLILPSPTPREAPISKNLLPEAAPARKTTIPARPKKPALVQSAPSYGERTLAPVPLGVDDIRLAAVQEPGK